MNLTIVVLMGNFVVTKLSEAKGGIGLYVNFCVNLVLLVTWTVAIILFRLSSSTEFTWGYLCSQPGVNNSFVAYDPICDREVSDYKSMLTNRKRHGRLRSRRGYWKWLY